MLQVRIFYLNPKTLIQDHQSYFKQFLQILSFATTRDEIDEKFNEYHEAKIELRNHQVRWSFNIIYVNFTKTSIFSQIAENKRLRVVEEAEKARKREERCQKKEDDKTPDNADDKKQKEDDMVKLTDRQREALVAQKEKEDRERQKKEDMKRAEAVEVKA